MSRDLILLALSMFTWGVGEGIFINFQPLYLQNLGADPLQIGAILSGVGLMMTVSHIPAGYLADRIGRKPVLISAWVLGFIATAIMAFAPNLTIFVAGMFIYGITLFVLSPLNSYVTAARGKLSVARAITLISASFNLGMVIGPWIGGFIGEAMGLQRTYYYALYIFVVSTALIFLIRPQPVEKHTPHIAQRSGIQDMRYLAYLGAVFMAIFATYLPQPLTANFLQNERALDLAQVGRLYSFSSMGVVALNLLLGVFPARFGFLLGQVAVGGFTLLLWQGSGLPLYQLAFFLLGGFKTTRSFAAAQIRQLVGAAQMGAAFGMVETVGASAVIVAPLVAGLLYRQNPSGIYAVSAVLIAVSILVSARLSPAASTQEHLEFNEAISQARAGD